MNVSEVLKKTNEFLRHEQREENDNNNSSGSRITLSEPYTTSHSKGKGGTAYLSKDVELKGTLYFGSAAEIHGKFEGEIIAEGPLTIGDDAVIKASINAASSIEIRGKIQGNIVAMGQVDLRGNAELFGDIQAPHFTVAQGVTFVGHSDTLQGKTPVTDFATIFQQIGTAGRRGGNSNPPSNKNHNSD